MKKAIFLFMFFAMMLGVSGWAEAGMIIPAAEQAKENSQAPEHSQAFDQNWDIGRIDFIHYAKEKSAARPAKTVTCYKLMGVKWNPLPVNYFINTASSSLDAEFVKSTIKQSAEIWDANTTSELFNDNYISDNGAAYGVYDNKNAITFGWYQGSNSVIAVTSIWYSKRTGKILEFDMLFNNYYKWGDAAIDPTVMDLENIATHELGHAVGLSDIYTDSCNSVTMYGYSDYGDISKRTLETADITGLQKIYGF